MQQDPYHTLRRLERKLNFGVTCGCHGCCKYRGTYAITKGSIEQRTAQFREISVRPDNAAYAVTDIATASTTCVASKGFFARVHHHVSFEYRRFLEDFVAYVALVSELLPRIEVVGDLQSKKILGIFSFIFNNWILVLIFLCTSFK